MIWTKDDKFCIKFSHVHFDEPTKVSTYVPPVEVRKPIRAMTTCVVMQGDNEFKGQSYCSIHDQYEKERGRKVSLKRAVEQLTREERTIIWKAYHNRKNQ